MSSRTNCSAGIYGVVIAHVVVFILAFLIGAIAGAGNFMDMSSGPPAPSAYGIKGGISGIGWVLCFYIATFGIIPLVVSVIGAVFGLGVGRFLQRLCAEKQNTNNDSQVALQRLAQKWGKAEPPAPADRPRESGFAELQRPAPREPAAELGFGGRAGSAGCPARRTGGWGR